MKRIGPLPPRWPGAVMIAAGSLGLIFTVNPRAAGIALIVVVCAACLFAALGAWAACMAAERADKKMGVTEEAARESARRYADELRAQYSMTENAAEIAARHFPARGSATEPQYKGGDQGLSCDTATPGATPTRKIPADSQRQSAAN